MTLMTINCRKGGCLKLELLQPERLPELFSGGLTELGVACDLLDLGLGAVATHVVFLEGFPQRGPKGSYPSPRSRFAITS